jgi:AcrR family transcriptional regulator
MKAIAIKKRRRASAETLWESRRTQILDTAALLFARHGYAETDTQLLADELKVGKGTIYRYFKNKRDLFLSAVDRGMRQLRAAIDSSIADTDDPIDKVARAVTTYLEFVAAHPEFVELLMQERAQFKDRKKPTYFEHREANIERWHVMYRALMAEGRIRTMPVRRITEVMTRVLYGTIFINYFLGEQESPEVQARDILDIVFHGILGERERRRRRACPTI